MVFICSFIVLAVIVTVFLLLFTSGVMVYSHAHKPETDNPQPSSQATSPQTIKNTPVKKAYIELNGRLIELHSKVEETSAKKQNFKVIYK